MLQALKAGLDINIGNLFKIYAMDDWSIVCRREGSGLMSPNYPSTLAGLRHVFAWLNAEVPRYACSVFVFRYQARKETI